MVRVTLPLTFLVFLLPLSSALFFDVSVSEETNVSVKDFDYSDEVDKVQEIGAVVENTGSIGCTYRFKGVFDHNGTEYTRYSSANSLWQGSNTDVELAYLPLNYTGVVDAEVFIEYCGQEELVEEFEFNVTERTLPESELESRTVESDETSARIEIDSEGVLVPEEEPVFWRTSSAEIIDGEASLEYDAPIFDDREELRYSVVDNGTVVGSTNVQLEPQPTLMEELQKHRNEMVIGVLSLSILLNILLVLRGRGLEKKLPDFNLPDFRK